MTRIGGHVLILDQYGPRPIFHDYGNPAGRVLLPDGWWRIEIRTPCGEIHWAQEWRDVPGQPSEVRNSLRRGITLRRDHASRFARPCRRCFR